jgi:hypothetical protein
MNFGADMMGDKADDTLTIGGCEALCGIGEPLGKTIDPDAAVGIQHDLDHAGVIEKPGDGAPERGAQHARAARASFAIVVRGRHCVPVLAGDKTILSRRGQLKEPETGPIQHLLGGVVA